MRVNRVDFRKGLLLALLATGLMAVPAERVAAQFHTVEISPTVGYLFGGKLGTREGELSIPSALSYGVLGSIRLSSSGWLELTYLRQQSDLNLRQAGFNEKQFDLHSSYWMIGGRSEFNSGGKAVPWGSFQLGATHFAPSNQPEGEDRDDVWKFAFMGGLGVKVPLGSRIYGQVLGRAIFTSVWGGTSWFCGFPGGCAVGVTGNGIWQGDVSAALTIPLGG